jgi:hypothetical protein
MYYTNEFVDSLMKQVTVPERKLGKRLARGFAKELDKDPMRYKMFGVYWWAMKDILRKYIHDISRWYCGSFFDPLMQSRADHGSRLRNLVAAVHYENNCHEYLDWHTWFDRDGGEHEYYLFDHDLGL